MRKRRAVLLMLLVAPVILAQEALHIKIAGRDVAIWKPATPAPKDGYPLVLFSHGYTGCSTQSIFLMQALAKAGYLVLAPDHADARCGRANRNERSGASRKGEPNSWRPEEPFRDNSKWSDETYKDRAADLKAVLDETLRGRKVEGVSIDADRIGIAGHSLGGYTVLGVAGAWPAWKDSRIKAVLALSPFVGPYVLKGALGHMNVPVMYQGGTRDLGITPTVRKSNGAYSLSSSPKYYVEFQGAGHFAWTNLVKAYQGIIDKYSVAFLDRYVKGISNPDPLAPLTGNPPPKGVSYLRVDLH